MILIGSKVFDGMGNEYIVDEQIGSGGFGLVFKISKAGQTLALKTASADGMTTSEFDALVNEAQLASRLKHENVIKVHYFHDGKTYPHLPPYIVMDYAEGGSLRKFVDLKRDSKQQLMAEEIKSIFLQILKGMKSVNEELLHRDFHPGNVLFQNGVIKITDFGLSKVIDAATRTKTFRGIQHMYYKSPEAWHGKDETIFTEMYSVGVAFYETATLQYPYLFAKKKDAIVELMEAHLFSSVQNLPTKVNSNVPEYISELILKMLKKKPEERFKSWEEAIEHLEKQNNASQGQANISALVLKAKQTEKIIEAQKLEAEKTERDKVQQQGVLSNAIAIVKSDLDTLIQQVNDQMGKKILEIDRHEKIGYKVSSSNSSAAVYCNFNLCELVERTEKDPFGFRQDKLIREKLTFEGKRVSAWGYIFNQYGKGVNLFLLHGNDDDIYGAWHVLYNNHSPISGKTGIQPFAFKNWSEFGDQLRSLRALGIYQSSVVKYSISEIQFLIEEIL